LGHFGFEFESGSTLPTRQRNILQICASYRAYFSIYGDGKFCGFFSIRILGFISQKTVIHYRLLSETLTYESLKNCTVQPETTVVLDCVVLCCACFVTVSVV
jgi:hypothetical protein